MTGAGALVNAQAVIECACPTCPACPTINAATWRQAERDADHAMWAATPDGNWFCPACADAGHIPYTARFCPCGHGHPWPCTCSDCTRPTYQPEPEPT